MWDVGLFNVGSNVTIELQYVTNETSLPEDTDNTIFTTTADSALGYTSINTTSAMLNGSTNATLTLFLNTTINDQPKRYSGPTFTLLDKTDSSGDSNSDKKKLGEEVGIPIGLIFFFVILAGIAFAFWRHRRNNSGNATGKSLPQRTATGGGGGHRRTESFHDEPTRGMELQNRHDRGGGDNWDWGRESIGSPVSPTGNHFRDELSRQKTGGRP